ncbi:MAG: ABC transporter permease, partial [Bacteroidetes bacterium]
MFSKKNKNVINVISAISMIGVGIGAFALIVVLSAFNGLEQLVEDLYGAFDPDIKIMPSKGKYFPEDALDISEIRQLDGVKSVSQVFEETALLQFKDKQAIATVKGVDSNYTDVSGVDSMITEGQFLLNHQNRHFLVLGNGLAYNLSLYIENNIEPLTVYAPQKGTKISFNPEKAFKKAYVLPAGIYTISPDFDFKYALADLNFVQKLFRAEGNLSALEIALLPGADANAVKQQIQNIAGDDFKVKTRYELNEMVFKTNNTEKWITYLILSFILIIATFNIIGSLTMLILEKTRDIKILKSLGVSMKTIMNIFLAEGVLISLLGG